MCNSCRHVFSRPKFNLNPSLCNSCVVVCRLCLRHWSRQHPSVPVTLCPCDNASRQMQHLGCSGSKLFEPIPASEPCLNNSTISWCTEVLPCGQLSAIVCGVSPTERVYFCNDFVLIFVSAVFVPVLMYLSALIFALIFLCQNILSVPVTFSASFEY